MDDIGEHTVPRSLAHHLCVPSDPDTRTGVPRGTLLDM